MIFKKTLKFFIIIAIIFIGGFFSLRIYQNSFIDEQSFCFLLMKDDVNKKVLQNFYEIDKTQLNGNAYRYGTESKAYLEYKQCLDYIGYTKCWNKLVNRNIDTVKDQVELSLSIGSVLHECSTNVSK